MAEPHHRRLTRHGSRRRLAPEMLALCVVAAVIAAFLAIAVTIVATRGSSQPGGNQQPPAKHTHDEKPAIEFAAALAPTREVYRYSVIEGGAHTPAELMAAINRDPVVADHYRSIDAEHVRSEIVDADRAVYVSYRRGDQIFWTSHKVMLRQGETILTDGATQVRSRCGNCISLEPMLPTADDEPEAAELDALAPAALSLEGANPPAARQSPFTLDDVIAGGLVGGVSRGVIAGNLGGPTLSDLPASEVGQGVGGQGTPGGIFLPDVSTPGVPGVPGVPGIPGIAVVVPADIPSNPPGQPPPVLVDLPPSFVPPDVPGNIPPGNLPPEIPTGPVPVPEPGTMMLVGGGALSMMLRRLRTRR